VPSRRQSPRSASSWRPKRAPGVQGPEGAQGAPDAPWPSEALEAQRPPPETEDVLEAQWPPGARSVLEADWPLEAQQFPDVQGAPDAMDAGEPQGVHEAEDATGPQGGLGGSPRAHEGPEDPEAAARQICLRLLTIEPRSRSQLAEALRRRHIPGPAAEAVLDRFTQAGLIDDPAFARAWVESRHHSRGLSRRALSAELHRRGVADEDVHDAIELVDDDQEAATARRLIAGKVRSTRGQPSVARVRKLMGVLARKGYGPALAYRVVREALEAEGAEGAKSGEAEGAEAGGAEAFEAAEAEIVADIAEPDLDMGTESSSC
jgi:regulatory protein